MSSLQLFGIPLVLVGGGVTLFLLLTIQVLTGLGLLKGDPKYHKWIGLAIFFLGLLHGTLGIIYIYGG